MSERSKQISRLLTNNASRISYIRAKLDVLITSQIRALRLKHDNMTQKQLAKLADMVQPRISAMERPGAAKFNLETLVRLASALKVGLIVKFVPFSEMLRWENGFSQDTFNPVTIDNDISFLTPQVPALSVSVNANAAQATMTQPPQYVAIRVWRQAAGTTIQPQEAPLELVAGQQIGGRANAAFSGNTR